MKQIQPVSIWHNGTNLIATSFYMISSSDNLTDNATFNYQLFSSSNISIAQGFLAMGGTDYTNYSSSADSNSYAYEWGATQLNLTLV